MEESTKLQPAASAVGSLNSKVIAIGREPSCDDQASNYLYNSYKRIFLKADRDWIVSKYWNRFAAD